MSFKMRAERTSCARHITLDWIGLYLQQQQQQHRILTHRKRVLEDNQQQ